MLVTAMYVAIVTQNLEVNLYTKILEVKLFAFAYRLFHRDFSEVNLYAYTYRTVLRFIFMHQNKYST